MSKAKRTEVEANVVDNQTEELYRTKVDEYIY